MTREELNFYNELLPFVARKSYENGEHDAIDRVLEVIDKELNEFADSICKDLPHKEEECIRIITAMFMTKCKDAVKVLKGGEKE